MTKKIKRSLILRTSFENESSSFEKTQRTFQNAQYAYNLIENKLN